MLRLKQTIGNTVLIHELSVEHTSEGGIVIPATAGEKYARIGKVIAKGPDVTADIRVGDTVIFDRFNRKHMIDGRMAKMVAEDHVFAVVEREGGDA